MHVIDRRLNPSGKSLPNRQRFLGRARAAVRDAVRDVSAERGIREIDEAGVVVIPVDSLDEPTFHHSGSGTRHHVLPGNREFLEGDRLERPRAGGGKGGGGSGAGEGGGGEDRFSVALSAEEFMDFFLEDLELPDLERKTLATTKAEGLKRAGYMTTGSPANLALTRTMRNALSRRIALKRPKPEELARLALEIATPERTEEEDAATREAMEALRRRGRAIPYIDPIDLRYRRFEPAPKPIAQAVMFCLMDVSGSMTEHMKDVAKRFFMLLYVFLNRRYEHVDIVFIRHTDEAKEVDEETFFKSRETGGTRVSSALDEMIRVARDRYPVSEWNIYGAQATDGDNDPRDNDVTVRMMREEIMPRCRYFAYLEVDEADRRAPPSSLWRALEGMGEDAPAIRRVTSRQEIYPVFRELFRKNQRAEA